MAEEILNNLLDLKITNKEILDWLTVENSDDSKWINFNKNCSKEEFITLFLSYLRSQFVSVLQPANISKPTPSKILHQIQATKIIDSTPTCVNKNSATCDINTLNEVNTKTQNSLSSSQPNVIQILKRRSITEDEFMGAQGDILSVSTTSSVSNTQTSTPIIKKNQSHSKRQDASFKYGPSHSEVINKQTTNSPLSSSMLNATETPIRHSIKENEKYMGAQGDISNVSLSSTTSNAQSKTPVIKKHQSHSQRRAALFKCSPTQNQNINPAFKNSIEYEPVNNRWNSKNISYDENSFPSLGRNSSSNSSNVNNSDCSDLLNSNVSQKSNISHFNRTLQSPISPLYNNSISSPINETASQKKYNENQTSNCYGEQGITGTPEQTSNVQRNSRSTPRQTMCLGDFIVMETINSKKHSAKKNKSKIILKNAEQKNTDQQSILSDTSSIYSGKGTRRRKVNPTRLNITDEKGNRENTVFGDISRPFTQNPQFVDVPPIDKSIDNASFEIERELVKLERQKNPTILTSATIVEEQIQPSNIRLPRTPNKSVAPKSLIIPNKELVKNMEILNVLAELYSGFWDYNLVVNPMTELYFIIHLITTQYTEATNYLSLQEKNVHVSVKKCDTNVTDSSDMKKDLSGLKKSLNFDDSLEDNSINESIKTNDKSNLESSLILDDLGCSTFPSDTDDDMLQTNKYVEQTSTIIQTNTSEVNDAEEKVNEKLDMTKPCMKTYLDSPHNCVYFSTKVLNYQKTFLKCLDRVTLKLLCENNQIAVFEPELCKFLDSIYNMKVLESNKVKLLLNIGTVDLHVYFQIDTDNREKFPSATAFCAFRKQRDMFYEILKIWEEKHLVQGWKFQVALVGKIKSMLSMHMDITNFIHITRLFKSQMLISCIQNGDQEDTLDDETVSFLKNLKDINPEKLTQLQRKLVTPLSQNGPVPLPSFPGVQEFYKDFILHAFNPMFYIYLENTFIHEIVELNNTIFTGSDIEETETDVDESTKQNFGVCLSSLRLLAKFLGYLVSLPYRSETSNLECVISEQIALRDKCLSHIDLQSCLQSAVTNGKLSLTVPWVVEYLSMMDHASLRLPCYKNILEMLYCIYRACNYHAIVDSKELMSPKTAVLMKLTIGWLFELPSFPVEFYHAWQSKYSDKNLKMICDTEQLVTRTECSSDIAEMSIVSVKRSLCLDKLEVVDDKILYSCCPFLRELNILLKPGNSSISNCTSYKHVTPVTSQLQESVKRTSTKHLELQLEEAFFHGQPLSTRKTVEYISERVASSCVKYICNKILPVEKQKICRELKKIVDAKYTDGVKNISGILKKDVLMNDVNILSTKASKAIRENSDKVIPKLCESRVIQSIESLLAEDCLQSVKNVCAKIAIRMATERINQWIQSHIVVTSTFIKDIEVELIKAYRDGGDEIIKEKDHNPKVVSPSTVVIDIRNVIWHLLEENGKSIVINDILTLCDQMYQSLTERSDLTLEIEKIISILSVDLYLFLITYRADLATIEIRQKLLKIWKIDRLNFTNQDSPVCGMLSPRNIWILARSSNKDVWLNFGKMLRSLVEENILLINILSDQAVAVFRDDWPIEVMKGLSACLKEAMEGYKSSDEETEKLKYLLGWVAGAYNDMDQDNFSFY